MRLARAGWGPAAWENATGLQIRTNVLGAAKRTVATGSVMITQYGEVGNFLFDNNHSRFICCML